MEISRELTNPLQTQFFFKVFFFSETNILSFVFQFQIIKKIYVVLKVKKKRIKYIKFNFLFFS